MTDKSGDPDFRAFAASRPKKRDVWYRTYYWGTIGFPVSIWGFLVPLLPVFFALGWFKLLSAIGLFGIKWLFWSPVALVWLCCAGLMLWKTEWS